ncbi:hypothetical protein BH09ACT3_BH09ACT3_06630 [soil metagenome]
MSRTERRAPRALAALVSLVLAVGGLTAVSAAAPAVAAAPISKATLATSGSDGSSGSVGVPLIGEQTTFTVSFDNISADVPPLVGYGPRVDLYFDSTGMDGDDGISFVSAAYLGQAVSAQQITIPALDSGVTVDDGMFLHPGLKKTAPIPAGYVRGDQLVILSLPFGSFTPGQPTVDIQVTAQISTLADLGVSDGSKDLKVLGQPWFRYGTNPLDDPAIDPPVYGADDSVSFRPQLYRLSQQYIGPEGETATGPSFPRSYKVSLDIASGQTITDVTLEQEFASEIKPIGITGGTVVPATGIGTVGSGSVSTQWSSVTGGSSATDAAFSYSYYVDQYRDDAQTLPVIDPVTGASASTVARATATNNWMASDPRDNTLITGTCTPTDEDSNPSTPDTCTPPTHYEPSVVEVGPYSSTFAERSLAVQKSVSGGGSVQPGDVVTWSVAAQVSDYFAFGDLTLADTISDGLKVDDTSFTIAWPGQSAEAFLPAEISVAVNTTTTGATTVGLDVSAALERLLSDHRGFAVGADVTTDEVGPSTFTIAYKTTVLKSYRAEPLPGSLALSPGDKFRNDVSITGAVATPEAQFIDTLDGDGNTVSTPNGTLLTLGAHDVTDGSSKSLRVANGTLTQSVYARNGVVGVAAGAQFAPGDLLTYRITQTLPVQSYENFAITDYLPLPVQRVTSISGPVDDLGGALPAVNRVAWGPSNTLHPPGGTPTITTDATSNSVKFTFGTREVPTQTRGETVDLLVTVQISNDPFADGLLLTNQARSAQTNSFSTAASNTALAQFILAEPELEIYKGVIATDAAGATFSQPTPAELAVTAPGSTGARWDTLARPITSLFLDDYAFRSSLEGVEAGDIVSYAIVVENTGGSPNGAFDVKIGDTKSSFLTQPTGPSGYNVQVRDGLGATVDYTGDLFGGGVTLTDGATGAIGAADTDGSNVIVITYDLKVAVNAGMLGVDGLGTLSKLGNTAIVDGWAGIEGGPRFASREDTGKITVTTDAAVVTKTYQGAEHSTGANARVGEHLLYRIDVAVPTGQHDDFIVLDTMGAGLGYVSTASIIAGGTNASTSTSPTVSGQTITWDFGTLTGSGPAHLVIEYYAMPKNLTSVNAGDKLSNIAWAGDNDLADQDDLDASRSAAPELTVIEPRLTLTASIPAAFYDAGDDLDWTVRAQNSSGYAAYDATVTIPVPDGAGAPTTVQINGVFATSSFTDGKLVVVIPRILDGETAVITFTSEVGAGNGTSSITSTSVATWQSVPTGTDHTPRTGTGTAPDDYRTTAAVTIAISAGSIIKELKSTSYTKTAAAKIAIGEVASFSLTTQLPEGDVAAFTITDQLPLGMTVVAGSVVVDADGFGAGQPNGALSPTTTINGRDLTVAFLPVSLAGDNIDADDFVTITYDAVLGNGTSGFGTTTGEATNKTNNASLKIGAAPATSATPVTMSYVQPIWTTSASASPSTLRPNDPVTFTLSASNTGGAQANDAVLTFTIPNAAATVATNTLGSIACGTTPAGFTCSVATSDNDNDVVVTYTPVDNNRFPANASAAQFTATVTGIVSGDRPDSATAFNSTFAITALASSTDVADYSNSGGPVVNRAANTSLDVGLTVRIPDPTVALTRTPSTTNVAAGTEITWTVSPQVKTIATDKITTTVVLSSGHELVSGSIISSASYDSATRTITWLATETVAVGASTPAFEYKTKVANPAPVSLVTITSTASVTNLVGGVYEHGADTDLTNNSVAVSAGVAASPDLTPTISDGRLSTDKIAPGEPLLTWTVAVRNVGNRDTVAGAVSVVIPEGVALVGSTGGWTTTTVGSVTTLSRTGLSLAGVNGSTVDELAAGTITVKVNDTIRAGQYSIVGTAITSDTNDANAANNSASDTAPLGGNPVIEITKVLETTGTVTAGTQLSWLITVSNTGNRGAEGLTVTDVLPASGVGDPASAAARVQLTGSTIVSSTYSGKTSTWSNGILEAGATNTYRVVATTTLPIPAGLESITNTATARENGANGVATPAPTYPLSSNVVTAIAAAPDIRIGVTNNATSLTPGSSYTYVVTAGNYGNQSEAGDTLVVTIPSGVTVTNAGGGTQSGSTITWTNQSIAGSSNGGTTPGTLVKNVVVTIDNPQAAGVTSKAVTAEITTGAEDTVKSDNVATDTDPITGAPNLAITKTADKTAATPGDTIVYTLRATNSGNRGASGVVITDTLPSEVEYVSSDSGSISAGVVTWPAATVAGGGATKTVTLTVRVKSPAPATVSTVSNGAGVCDDGANGPTSTPICGAVTRILPLDAAPDYRVTLGQDVSSAAPGGAIVYTVGVENLGTQDGLNGTLTIDLPANTTVVSAAGANTATAGKLIYSGLSLAGKTSSAGGGTAGFGFTLQVTSPQLAGVTTVPVAAAAAVSRDSLSTNNTANVSATITGGPNVVVTKTATASVVPGGTITWQVTVTNTGNRGASGVVVTDTLPAGINTVSAPGGTILGSTVTYSTGVVEVGQVVTYTLTAKADTVTAAGVESVLNTAAITAVGTSNGTNTSTTAELTSSATTTIDSRPDLIVGITDNRSSMTIGTHVSGSYEITLSNVGNQNTTTGEVTFTLPSWLTVTTPGLTGTVGATGTTYVLSGRTVTVGSPSTITVQYTIPPWVAAGIESAEATASVTNGSTSGTPNEHGATGPKTDDDSTIVVAQPELVVTAAMSGGHAAGASGTWTATVANTGTQGGTGVEVTAALPENLLASYVSGTATSAVAAGDRVFTWPTFAMNPGDPARTFSVPVTMVSPFPAGTSSVDYLATVQDDAANGAELVTSNNSASLSLATADAPNMRVVASPTTASAAPGDAVTIDLLVTNQGSLDTTAAVLTATIPAGYTVKPSSHDSDGRVFNATLNRFEWSALSVSGDSTQTLTRTLVLDVVTPQPAGRSTITVDATITTTADQTTDSTHKSATHVLTLTGAPDLRVTQEVSDRTAVEGAVIEWTVDVDNIGVRGASGVTVAMTVPMAVDASTLDTDGGAWDATARTITWIIPTVAVGAPKATYLVEGTLWDPLPLVGSQLRSEVAVTDDGLNGTDTDSTNNADATIVQSGVDLLVKKSLVSGIAVRGEDVEWLITVTNNGPQTVTSLMVDERIPAEVTDVVITPSAGSFDPVTTAWTGLSLAPGSTVSLKVTAKVLASATSTRLVNTVKFTAPDYNVVDLTTLADTDDVLLTSPLARTGLQLAPWLAGVLLLLLAGALLLLFSHRRSGGGRHRGVAG